MDKTVRGALALRTFFTGIMDKRVYKKQKVKMVRCPNCGAMYEEGLLHCPYCRSVDDYQDESEYLEDLDELKDKMEDMHEDVLREHNRNQTTEAARDFKKILMRVGFVALIILLLVGIATFFDKVVAGNSEQARREEQKEEYLWKQENFSKLDELYEKGDYEGLVEFAENTDNIGIYDWEHYPLIDGLQILKYIPSDLAMVEELERENKTDSDHYRDSLAFLFRDELELLYFDHRKADEKDIEIINGMSGEYIRDLETRFALTPEELETLEKKAAQDMGEFYLSECKDFLKDR